MFYVIVQVALYIFCFRVDDFSQTEGGTEFIQALRLTDIVACKLKPLKVGSMPLFFFTEFNVAIVIWVIIDFIT